MSGIRPVVLSGGSGTRLWPLSTATRPKQFAELLPGSPSLFEATLSRLSGLEGLQPPLVVTGSGHLGLVEDALERLSVGDAQVVVEPSGRNTAPAAVAAALVSRPEDCLVILPSDHLVADRHRFLAHVADAVEMAERGSIVTFGIEPTRPETGYGYLQMGPERGAAREMTRFKEKPELAEAKRLVADGDHVWNSGMFVLTSATLLEAAARHCPEVLEGVRGAVPGPRDGVYHLGLSFSDVESISFDHAVMEKVEEALVIPISVGWDDIGSFRALWSVSEKDSEGNVIHGDVVANRVSNSYLRATSRPIAVADMEGLVVVETDAGVLVVPMESSQAVKDLQSQVEAE